MVAGADPLDARARVDDHPGCLVAENDRQGLREVAVDDVEVARTHPTRSDPDQRLALLRRREVDVEDLDGVTRLPQNGRPYAHGGERTVQRP